MLSVFCLPHNQMLICWASEIQTAKSLSNQIQWWNTLSTHQTISWNQIWKKMLPHHQSSTLNHSWTNLCDLLWEFKEDKFYWTLLIFWWRPFDTVPFLLLLWTSTEYFYVLEMVSMNDTSSANVKLPLDFIECKMLCFIDLIWWCQSASSKHYQYQHLSPPPVMHHIINIPSKQYVLKSLTPSNIGFVAASYLIAFCDSWGRMQIWYCCFQCCFWCTRYCLLIASEWCDRDAIIFCES